LSSKVALPQTFGVESKVLEAIRSLEEEPDFEPKEVACAASAVLLSKVLRQIRPGAQVRNRSAGSSATGDNR
jgi:hypothetical protein